MFPSKEKIEKIKQLKESNREKIYSQYKTFYKSYKHNPRPITSIFPMKTARPNKTEINTMLTMTGNSKSPLQTFYNTFYTNQTSPNQIEQTTTSNTKKKKYFGLDGNTPLPYFNGTQYTNASKYDAGGSTLTGYNTMSNFNKTQYTKEDELLVQNAFYNINQPRRILDKETAQEIYNRFNIEKKLTEDERKNIEKTIRPFSQSKAIGLNTMYGNSTSNNINGIYFEVKGEPSFRTPFKAYKALKLNNQLAKKVEEIRNIRQFQSYQEEFEKVQTRRIQTAKMPHIRVVSKHELKLAETRNKKIQELMDMAEVAINTGDPKGLRPAYAGEEKVVKEGEPKLTREEMLKVIEIGVRYVGANYHPQTRTQFGMTFGDGNIYLYGGLAGRKLGDLWSCDIMNKKALVWKKLFDKPYKVKAPKKKEEGDKHLIEDDNHSLQESESHNISYEEEMHEYTPLHRYGHTMHFYKHKLYIIGGYFHNWKNNPTNETLMIIYDLMSGKWYKDTSGIREKDNETVSSNMTNSSFNSNIFQDINYSTYQKKTGTENVGPCLRRNHVSILIGSTIFLYGGVNQNDKYLSDCWVYNLKCPGWSTVEIKGRIPPPLGYHCCTLGLEKERLYNPALNIYKVPESTRKTVQLIKYEGVFFFGGMNDNRVPTNLFFLMKIGKKQMEFEIPKTYGEPPSPRISSTIDFYPNLNFLILHGGRNDTIEKSFFNDFFVLDLETMNWTKGIFKKEVSIERAEHQSMVFGNKLLILGGVNINSFMNFDFSIINLDFI